MTIFNLVMIYSASIAYATSDGGSQFSFVSKQAVLILLMVATCLPLSLSKIGSWQRIIPFYLIVPGLPLLLALFVGREINSATHWIHIGSLNLQPVEFSKLATALYLSNLFTRYEEMLRDLNFSGWSSLLTGIDDSAYSPFKSEAQVKVKERFRKFKIPILPITLVAVGLVSIIGQLDFGSFAVIVVITMGMLFLAGFPWRHFTVLVTATISGMGLLVLAASYRMAHVTAFLDPRNDPLGKGYQLTHSSVVITRDGWSGEGLGTSLEKRFYLPEAHTNFISAVIGEELGFLGILVLVFCYGWPVWRAFSIGKQVRDPGLMFSAYITNGTGVQIGIQSFFSIGVNIDIPPTKDLILPFMSYDNSAVFIMLICVTLLLRIDYEDRRKMRSYSAE